MTRQRVYALDWIRGIAVIGMVLHHGLFTLETVSWLFDRPLTFDFLMTPWFFGLQTMFVAAFLIISGICTAYSRNVLRRGAIVTGAAALITLVTGVVLPAVGVEGLDIWFGILHMIGVSMLLYGLFTCKKRWVPVCTALVLFLLYFFMVQFPQSGYTAGMLMVLGFPFKGFFSADYYPLLPYFFLFFLGALLGPMVKEGRLPARFYTARFKPVEWLGRHALWIYLVHQPLFFALFWGYYALIEVL